jgi:hypothetical protein
MNRERQNIWYGAAATLAIAILLFGLGGCKGDTGPAGPPGANACTQACHTDDYTMADYILAVKTEFAESKHNTGDTYVRRGSTNSPECSRCHTTEGYQHYAETGTAVAVAQSSRIGCFACHAPHTNENFSQRKTGATAMYRGGPYDKGESNTCAVCHQIQEPSPSFASADTIKSPYWGPHHGPQASVLAGMGAYVFAGQSYSADHAHNSITKGCVNCHMARVATDGLAGGHSFKMTYDYHGSERLNSKGCVGCHTSWTDTKALQEVDDAKTAFEARLDAIADILIARGWLNTDKATVTTGASAAFNAADRGALYNYLALEADRSGGVHNPVYAEAVLAATETYLAGSALAER